MAIEIAVVVAAVDVIRRVGPTSWTNPSNTTKPAATPQQPQWTAPGQLVNNSNSGTVGTPASFNQPASPGTQYNGVAGQPAHILQMAGELAQRSPGGHVEQSDIGFGTGAIGVRHRKECLLVLGTGRPQRVPFPRMTRCAFRIPEAAPTGRRDGGRKRTRLA